MFESLDYTLIFTMCFMHLLALISPGPDFFLTLKNALSFGHKVGFATATGFGAGMLFHLTYCIAGVAVVLVKMSWFPYIKYIAALYLIWMGLTSLWSIRHFKAHTSSDVKTVTGTKSLVRGFMDGFITNVFNPKAVLFTLGIFTTVVTPKSDRTSLIIAAAVMVLVTILWFVIVSLIFGSDKIRKFYFKSERALSALFGIFFVTIGILFCLN